MASTQSAGPGETRRALVLAVLVGVSLLWWGGCEPAPKGVQAVLEGRVTVDPAVDSSKNYEGFRVLVVAAQGRAIDTLAHAITDRSGRFQTRVTVPERGIYPLMIWGRQGARRLATTRYVVAEGDTARVQATLPLRGRLQVRSPENNALAGYQNAMAQHRRTLLLRLKGEAYDVNTTAQGIRQSSSVLWDLQSTYPGTYAGQLAAVEALSLLEGWNDSLVVERLRRIEPTNPRYVEAARIGRRAAARWKGQEAALNLLDSLEARATTTTQQAGVQAVRIRAFIDSLQKKAALSAAEQLRTEYPNTKWAEWADRALYEVQNLLPGAAAPAFTVRTLQGDSLALADLQGQPVVLEFYKPESDLYARQLPTRNALYRATQPDSVAFVSVSTEPDSMLTRAFLSNRSLPGHRVIAPGGLDDSLTTAYNVVDLPVRFLLDARGRIVGRYDGAAFLALQDELLRLLKSPAADDTAPRPAP